MKDFLKYMFRKGTILNTIVILSISLLFIIVGDHWSKYYIAILITGAYTFGTYMNYTGRWY